MAVEPDDVDVGRVAVVGVCASIFVYVFIVIVRVLFMNLEAQEEVKKRINETPRALKAYQQEQATKLQNIGSAMASTTQEYSKRQ